MRRKKKHIDWAEFRGNYALAGRNELLAMISGYKERLLKRNELRSFAAGLEARALHHKSSVDVYRIVNAKSKTKGVRRLSSGQIDAASERVRRVLSCPLRVAQELSSDSRKQVPVPRKMARHIAQGRCRCTEAIMLFYYCLRRVRQVKPLQRLEPTERYARFTYRSLETISGIPRGNLCRALRRLRDRGFLDTRFVEKQNENAYGLLFVDGHQISLAPASCAEKQAGHKTTTPNARFDNAPGHKPTTLRKKDPKTVIQKQKALPCGKITWETSNRAIRRLVRRAEAMRAEQLDQAA